MVRRRPHELGSDVAAAARAFDAVLEELEPAKAALAGAAPGTRLPGIPLAEALARFIAGAERARASMPAWWLPSLAGDWAACSSGLDRALDAARLALQHPLPDRAGFVGLVELIQTVLDPLEPFAAAEQALRRVRR
jgi:hypothetical protein